jgi:hypothetical protein
MLSKSRDRAHAFFESFSHRLFSSDLFERQSKSLPLCFSRDHHYSINVTKENVSWPNGYAADFNGNPKIMDLVAGRGVLAIRSETEGGITQSQDFSGVSYVPIQHGSPGLRI